MARGANVKEIGQLIEEEPFDMAWFSYFLGSGYGAKLTKYQRKDAMQGVVATGIGNEVSILQVHKKLIEQETFDGVAGFYVGVLCFFSDKIFDNMEYVDKVPKNSINTIVSQGKCPERLKDKLYDICHHDYDFIDFINAAYELERTNFDKESAISVYQLQGRACIFQLLCQMFYNNKGINSMRTCLISDTPVILDMDVSDYFSGCHFPVCVSPMVSDFEWRETSDGWFLYGLYGGEWVVVDVAGVGRVNLSNYALANRMNYWGAGGQTVPFVVCWNWQEIIDAYGYFKDDVLIRDLNNTLFNHYWFKLGPDSKICVRFRDNHINTLPDYHIKPNFNDDAFNSSKKTTMYLVIDMKKNFIDICDLENVVFSDSEVADILQIGSLL